VPEPVPEPEPEPAPAPVPEPEPEPAPVPEPAHEPEVEAPSFSIPEPEPGSITYVNVTQTLVEEKAEKYIRMFGVCDCPRCLADVKALALNNLPPKYVVMRAGEMVPRITVYEAQLNHLVTAQLLRACKSVMDNPRHEK